MGQLIVVLCLTSLANIVTKPTPLVFQKITFTDAVIKDGKKGEGSEGNNLNNIATEDEDEKVLVYRRYDIPSIPSTELKNDRIDEYVGQNRIGPQAYIQDRTTESYFENQIDFTGNHQQIEAPMIDSIRTPNKNAGVGTYHVETFDAMDALIHKTERMSTSDQINTFESVFSENPFETEVFYETFPETEVFYVTSPETKLSYETPSVFYNTSPGTKVFHETSSGTEISYDTSAETEVSFETPSGTEIFYDTSRETEVSYETPSGSPAFYNTFPEPEVFYETQSGSDTFYDTHLEPKVSYKSPSGADVSYQNSHKTDQVFYITPPPKKKTLRVKKKAIFEPQTESEVSYERPKFEPLQENQDYMDVSYQPEVMKREPSPETEVFYENEIYHEQSPKAEVFYENDPEFYENQVETGPFYGSPFETKGFYETPLEIEQFYENPPESNGFFTPPPEATVFYETQFEADQFKEPSPETELTINFPRELTLMNESPRVSKLTTISPSILQGSLFTLSTSSHTKFQQSSTQFPTQLVLPSPPKPPARPPEIPKTLQSVFKYNSLQTLQPPPIPSMQLSPFSAMDFKLVSFTQNNQPSNSTEDVFYRIKEPAKEKNPNNDILRINYNPAIDDYNAPASASNPSKQKYLPPKDDFLTTSEIYTPPFGNYSELESIDSVENAYGANEIDHSHTYDTENRVSNTEKFSQNNNFRIPVLVDDPLLNFLAYGTVLGMAINSLGANPFDVVNVELRNLREKRSNSDG